MASRAFTAVARGVLFILVDPDDDTRRVLGTRQEQPGPHRSAVAGLSYQGRLGHDDRGRRRGVDRPIEWLGELERSLRELVEQAATERADRTITQEAKAWLLDYLSDQGGCAASTIIMTAGARAGYNKAALHRARHAAHIRSENVGFPRITYWRLPPTTDTATNPEEAPE